MSKVITSRFEDYSKWYNDIVLNTHTYNRKFELFFIIEKDKFLTDILDALQSLPPTLKPLCVTVVLIESLSNLPRTAFFL